MVQGKVGEKKAVHKQQEMSNDVIKASKYKGERKGEREFKWHEKVMQAQFFRDTHGIAEKGRLWLWLDNGDLKKETDAMIMATQEQAIRTHYVQHDIKNSRDSKIWRMCGERGKK